jgi:hypothetical protein
MYYAIESTRRLDNDGFGRSNNDRSAIDRGENTRERFSRLLKNIVLTPEEVRQKEANQTPNSRDQYQRQMKQACDETRSRLESLVRNFQFSVVRELLRNKVQDIRTGPDYITQMFRVKSSIVPSLDIEDKSLILKLFNYLGCGDPGYFFGPLISIEDIQRYEVEDHAKETWIYHKLEPSRKMYPEIENTGLS